MVKINKSLFQQAKRYLVGGVNSPVRAFKAVGGYPVFAKRARGAKIYGECAKEFIDYCLGFGALILGHANPGVIKALGQSLKNGVCFGTATKLETELAKVIIAAVPSIERIRFTNSGTEAVMGAVRLARAYSGKTKIVRFAGSYHGAIDYFLDCPGIPEDFKKHTLTAPYNNIGEIRGLVERNKKDIAAIIVEPAAGNMGVVLPKEGFLEGLREICDKDNILLIFDEVITGFRCAFGGAQKLFGIKPDLTCLGKIIGGGLPVGAFGGRVAIMQLLAPEGEIYQAGTFSGNPLTVSAGLATLKILAQDNPYPRLLETTKWLCENIRQAAGKYEIKINFIGSMFSIFFTDKKVTDYNSARTQNTELFKRFYHGLLKEGIYFSPSGFEANFISTAHTQQDLERTLGSIRSIFERG